MQQRRTTHALIACIGLLTIAGNASASEYDDIYPLVGAALGTPYPYPQDIARNPTDVPSQALPNNATVVITADEVESYIAPKAPGGNWAGDGTDERFKFFVLGGGHPGQDQLPRVPGPFIKVKQGNTLTIKLENHGELRHALDFHAVTGKMGGAAVLAADPGGEATFTFTAKNPGLYVYHCVGNANPRGVVHHMNNGMYGLILVEPRNRDTTFSKFKRNAQELYMFQQDVYRDPTTLDFDEASMLNTMVPNYATYNGRIGALVDYPLRTEVGSKTLIYHGAAGGHIPSFHMVGEVFDFVWRDGDLTSRPARNLQSVAIPSAGAVALGLTGEDLIPTDATQGDLNLLVDHGSPYLRKGAMGLMVVE